MRIVFREEPLRTRDILKWDIWKEQVKWDELWLYDFKFHEKERTIVKVGSWNDNAMRLRLSCRDVEVVNLQTIAELMLECCDELKI